MSSEPYLTVTEAARYSGVSRQTVYAWIASALIRTRVIAGRTLVMRSSLARLMAARRLVGRGQKSYPNDSAA